MANIKVSRNMRPSYSVGDRIINLGLGGLSPIPSLPFPFCPLLPSPYWSQHIPEIQLWGLGRCKLPLRVRAETGQQTILGAF